MRLPNGDHAIIEPEKIRDYCLSESHPRGRHKARVFLAALGLTADDWPELSDALREVARDDNASPGVSDIHGNPYIIDFETERTGRTTVVRSCWIILSGEVAPRFVTCFVL